VLALQLSPAPPGGCDLDAPDLQEGRLVAPRDMYSSTVYRASSVIILDGLV
jgi:hypothetical protein